MMRSPLALKEILQPEHSTGILASMIKRAAFLGLVGLICVSSASADERLSRYEKALTLPQALVEKHCPGLIFKKSLQDRTDTPESRKKVLTRASGAFHDHSSAFHNNITALSYLEYRAGPNRQPPYLIIDIFHFGTDAAASEALEVMRKSIERDVGSSFLPHIRLISNRDTVGMIIRPHPDEFRSEKRRGVNDRCFDAIQDELRKALESVSPKTSKSPVPNDINRFIRGDSFDSTTCSAITDAELSGIKAYPDLKSLALISDSLSPSGYDALASLDRLRSVSLGPARVTDRGLDGLRELTDLEVVRVGYSRITDAGLARFAKLTKVKDLSLRGNLITGTGFPALKELKELRDLGLNWCPVSDEGLKLLPPLPKLTALFLADSDLTDNGIQHLTKLPALKYVVLRRTAVTDRGLAQLAEIRTLTALDVIHTNVTKSGIESFRQNRPDVAIVAHGSSKADFDRLEEAEKRL